MHPWCIVLGPIDNHRQNGCTRSHAEFLQKVFTWGKSSHPICKFFAGDISKIFHCADCGEWNEVRVSQTAKSNTLDNFLSVHRRCVQIILVLNHPAHSSKWQLISLCMFVCLASENSHSSRASSVIFNRAKAKHSHHCVAIASESLKRLPALRAIF